MTIWELVEARMKILGALNIIAAFPPLANALVISLYASDVNEEAMIRGWPREVYDLMRAVKERVGYETLSEVLGRLLNHRDFLENIGDMVYYDLVERQSLAMVAFNYISALNDVGFDMGPHISCLDLGYTSRLVDLTGGSLDDLRALDLAFKVRVYRKSGDPLEDTGEVYDDYICSPKWIKGIRDKIVKTVKLDETKELEAIKFMLSNVLRSNRRLYSYIRLAYTTNAKTAWEHRRFVKVIPGNLHDFKPLISLPSEHSIPAINYSIRDLVLKAMDSIEGELLRGGCGNETGVIVETLPTIYVLGFKNPVNVVLRGDDDLEIVMKIAEIMGLRVGGVEDSCVKLEAGGGV